jgi:transaldolase
VALYLDSASVDDARQSVALGYVTGITTNPALMAATGRAPTDMVAELCDVHPGTVFCQPIAGDAGRREAEVRPMAGLRRGRVGIKLPCEPDKLRARSAPGGRRVRSGDDRDLQPRPGVRRLRGRRLEAPSPSVGVS